LFGLGFIAVVLIFQEYPFVFFWCFVINLQTCSCGSQYHEEWTHRGKWFKIIVLNWWRFVSCCCCFVDFGIFLLWLSVSFWILPPALIINK
jgi:hypothetical protein